MKKTLLVFVAISSVLCVSSCLNFGSSQDDDTSSSSFVTIDNSSSDSISLDPTTSNTNSSVENPTTNSDVTSSVNSSLTSSSSSVATLEERVYAFSENVFSSMPTKVKTVYSYEGVNGVKLSAESTLEIMYGDEVYGHYTLSKEKLNEIGSSDELISIEKFEAYIKGDSYYDVSQSISHWESTGEENGLAVINFDMSFDFFVTSSIVINNSIFFGKVKTGREDNFLKTDNATIKNIAVDIFLNSSKSVSSLEVTCSSKNNAKVTIDSNFTYDEVSFVIPE